MIRRLLFLIVMTCLLALLGASCSDDKPNDPVNPLPVIKTFIFSPDSILILDSTTLVWNVQHADSMVILPTGDVVKPVDSGKIAVFPDSSLIYTAIAYNQYGTDTVVANLGLTVVPFRIQPKLTSYFRGTYGSSSYDPPLVFVVSDSTGRPLPDTTVYFSVVNGDGTLSTDSAVTDANGEVTAAYEFTGNETETKLRARFSNVDSSDVWLRVNTLRFKTGGQAQYVMFEDQYVDIVNYNGAPASIDTPLIPGVDPFVVANYEASYGAVFIVFDENLDGVIEDTCSILGAIVVDSIFLQPDSSVNTRYSGTDQFGIGIGSSYPLDIRTVYGQPDSLYLETSDPLLPAIVAVYDTLIAEFWLYTSDSTVFQITLQE